MSSVATASRVSLVCLVALLAACDGLPDEGSLAETPEATAPLDEPTAPVDEPLDPGAELGSPDDVPAAPLPIEPPFISRFAPHQGLVGVELTILGTWCDAASACQVTVGGAVASAVDNPHVLTVTVPPDAVTGPVCVTLGPHTTCGETFTVLTGPLLYASSPSSFLVGADEAVIDVSGDGFAPESEVWLDWVAVPTTYDTTRRLSAVLPASAFATAGARQLLVYSPGGRCGVYSQELAIAVENPGPAISAVTPGHGAWLVIVYGGPFVPDSVVMIDGIEVRTAFLSATALEAHPSPELAPGAHAVQVRTPAPGGGVSAPVTLDLE